MARNGEDSDRELAQRLARYRQRLVADGRHASAEALDRLLAEAPPGASALASRRPRPGA